MRVVLNKTNEIEVQELDDNLYVVGISKKTAYAKEANYVMLITRDDFKAGKYTSKCFDREFTKGNRFRSADTIHELVNEYASTFDFYAFRTMRETVKFLAEKV